MIRNGRGGKPLRQELLQKKVEEKILDSYEDLYRLAYSYVRNADDAMDIVQESVYKAMKNAGRMKEEGYIATWLWRITVNTAIDFIRKNRREVATETFYETGKEDTYADVDTIEALEVLDDRERAVVVLRFFEDRKIQEVAEILNENVNTVKSILYRSLKKLKVELAKGDALYEG